MAKIQTKTVKLSEIHLNPDNPRTITGKAMANLTKSLKEFPEMLELREIVVDESMMVLGGNMRLRALQESGTVECVAKIVTGLTDKQKREFVIKDNAGFGEWDMDALANAWDDLPLDEWGLTIPALFADVNDVVEDDFDPEEEAEKIEDPITQPGDVIILGRHRLICGDATKQDDIEKLMDGKMADMVWTDPPYGVSYAGKNEFLNSIDEGNRVQTEIINDHMTAEDMFQLWVKAFSVIGDVLKPGGVYYSSGPQGGDLLLLLLNAIREAGLQLKHSLIWVKNNHVLGRCDYNYKHEPILYGWKEGAAHYFNQDFSQTTVIDDDADLKKMTKDQLLQYARDIQKLIPTTVFRENKPQRNGIHPTMKPIALVARMIRNSTDHTKDEIVLDPFGGSGTTLMAAEQTGRIAYLCELDQKYCDVIKLRWEQFTGGVGVLA